MPDPTRPPDLRYVTSIHRSARSAHLGYPITYCYRVFPGAHTVSTTMPANRTLCPRCIAEAVAQGVITAEQGRILRERPPLEGPDELLRLLCAGLSDRAIAMHLRLSTRTVARRITAAMTDCGARSRFQFGYIVGQGATR